MLPLKLIHKKEKMHRKVIAKLILAEGIAAILLTGCGDIYVTQRPIDSLSGTGSVAVYSDSGYQRAQEQEKVQNQQESKNPQEVQSQQYITTLLPDNAEASTQTSRPVVTGEITEEQAKDIAMMREVREKTIYFMYHVEVEIKVQEIL